MRAYRGATVCLLLLLTLPVFSEDLWYASYESGMRAFQSGDWKKAETRLNAALKAQPAQGKHIKAYGTKFIRYIPQYYLGVISIRMGNYREALERFKKVQAEKLLLPGDAEYAEMDQLVRLAQDQLTSKDVAESPEAKQAPVVSDESPARAQEAVEVALPENHGENQNKEEQQRIAQERFDALLQEAETALRARKYSSARDLVKQAAELGLDPKTIESNTARIEAAERSELLASQRLKVTSRAPDEEEVKALMAFYSADYNRSIVLLEKLASRNGRSARLHFYLGCSHAALGLLQGRNGKPELQKSREHFARSRQLDPALHYDARYISPRILQLYQQ